MSPRLRKVVGRESPRVTSTEEPDGGNLLVRIWRGAGVGNLPAYSTTAFSTNGARPPGRPPRATGSHLPAVLPSAGESRSSHAGLLQGVHSRGHCGRRVFEFPVLLGRLERHRGHGDYWVLSLSGNCWRLPFFPYVFLRAERSPTRSRGSSRKSFCARSSNSFTCGPGGMLNSSIISRPVMGRGILSSFKSVCSINFRASIEKSQSSFITLNRWFHFSKYLLRRISVSRNLRRPVRPNLEVNPRLR